MALQELPQSYVSSLAGSAGASQQAAAAAGEAEKEAAGKEDAFLRFSVKFRPRDGGPEQVVDEVSHFKLEGGEWLYFNEVDL